MQTLIEKIKNGNFWRFPGGVKPPGFKEKSNQHEIERLPLAEKLFLPVKQHVGLAGRITVQPGDRVLKGQAITRSSNPMAVPVHAPTSGTIAEITEHVSCHPSGLPEKTVVLVPDSLEEWVDLEPISDYQALNRASLVEVICKAGISGMGGAGFPTNIKLSSDKNIEFLVINGVECEPYITSDDRLMREHAWQIRQGIDVLCHILQPQHVLIAIEDNKPEAYAAMEIAVQDNPNYVLCGVETVYPAGGEKQLIQVLTGREVPSQGLPVDIGIMMHNVGTCFAIADAIFSGKPLIERVVTLAGDAIEHSQNLWLPLGTPVGHAVTRCRYIPGKQKQKRFIMGGPMMGFTIHSPLVPVIKTSNCILVPSDSELPPPGSEMACIRCGACADACPAGLLPQQLYWHAKGQEYDKAQELNLFDCIECGACAYVCPSNIPLVHYYRSAKAEIRNQQEEAEKAAKAKVRFEARNQRLERDKQEREEKARQRAQARVKKTTVTPDKSTEVQESSAAPAGAKEAGSASDRVAAALARAKAKKAAKAIATNTDAATAEEKPLAEKKTQQITINEESPSSQDTKLSHAPLSTEDAKKQKVAEAIARAKAKKASQQQKAAEECSIEGELTSHDANLSNEPLSTEEAKKQKVAAAIARAKARKATQQQKAAEEPSVERNLTSRDAKLSDDTLSAEDAKKQKVAAAVARAKARKAAQQRAVEPNDSTTDNQQE